jgi:hypothetical protein
MSFEAKLNELHQKYLLHQDWWMTKQDIYRKYLIWFVNILIIFWNYQCQLDVEIVKCFHIWNIYWPFRIIPQKECLLKRKMCHGPRIVWTCTVVHTILGTHHENAVLCQIYSELHSVIFTPNYIKQNAEIM